MFPYVIPPMMIIHIRPPGCCCFCVLNSVYITYHYFQVMLQPDLFLLWLVGSAAFHITSSGSLSVRKSREEPHSLILYLLFAFSFPSSLWVGIFSHCLFLFHSYPNSDKKEKPAQQHHLSAPRFLPPPSICIANFLTFSTLKKKNKKNPHTFL